MSIPGESAPLGISPTYPVSIIYQQTADQIETRSLRSVSRHPSPPVGPRIAEHRRFASGLAHWSAHWCRCPQRCTSRTPGRGGRRYSISFREHIDPSHDQDGSMTSIVGSERHEIPHLIPVRLQESAKARTFHRQRAERIVPDGSNSRLYLPSRYASLSLLYWM